jgi:hypothetical protein
MAKISKYNTGSQAFDAGQFNTAAFQVVNREYTRRGIPPNECLENLRSACLTEQRAIAEKHVRDGLWNR